MSEMMTLRSAVEELKNLQRQITRLLRAKRIRGILKKIGIGRFIYRDVDRHILQYETQKALLIKNVESCVRETLVTQRQQLKTIEAYRKFLSKEQEDKLLNRFGTFEADLEYLKSLNFLDSELISSSLSEIVQSRQFVVGYNEKLERDILKQNTMKLKETFLQAERDFTSLSNGQQYFSKRELKSWKERWRNLLLIAEQCKAKGVTEIDFQDSLDLVVSVHNDGERLLNECNKSYVEKEILKSELFETIDGHVLNEEQRKAIVVDEANTLVLAGAGTGKTTALLGKALYIVSKGLAVPESVLIVAFNKSVVKENEKKVNNIKSNVKFTVKTYHSLGLEVIGKARGEQPNVPTWAEDKLAIKSQIRELIKNRMNDDNFAQLVNNYFLYLFETYKSMFEFTSLGDYYRYLNDNGVRTLKGHRVKSLEECEIANFLYINGVSYVYEKPFEEEKTSTVDRRQYKPDFTLTDYGIYIEHFGIDRNRNTAPWVPRDKYLADMKWKIELHKPGKLIQTFSYQRREGNLLEQLEAELLAHGVEFHPLPTKQIFDELNKMGRVNSLAKLLCTFINLYKSNGESFETIENRVKPDDSRARAFLRIFAVIYEDYIELLRKNGDIDFNDMINEASELIEQNKYRSPFQYILVDEFQDISQSRKRFLKTLLSQNNAKLFCVGDDWQSIYRFAGGDISILTNFEKNFGLSETRLIQETQRFNDKLCDFSTKFVLKNPFQIPKKITSKTKEKSPAVTIVKEKTDIALDKIIREINQISNGKEEILIINRYQEIGKPANINKLVKNYHPKLVIKYTTAHKAKGLTVDFVVVIGLKGGEFGFPCQIEDDPLLDLVKGSQEQFLNAEERRLFYVAITRARKHVYLVVDEPYNVSSFVTEIENNEYEISTTGQNVRTIHCPVCQTGIVVWGEKHGRYECSNSPYCSYVPRSCPKCREDRSEGGNGFLYKDNSKYLCSNDRCSFQAKACPDCEDGYLVLRPPKYGRPFFGCVNYSTKGCRHTEEESTS